MALDGAWQAPTHRVRIEVVRSLSSPVDRLGRSADSRVGEICSGRRPDCSVTVGAIGPDVLAARLTVISPTSRVGGKSERDGSAGNSHVQSEIRCVGRVGGPLGSVRGARHTID